MITATLTPPVTRASQALHPEEGEAPAQLIPVHRLSGRQRLWADRLLSLLKGQAVDGIEWSLKFSLAGLVGNRFLLGIRRENWSRLDFSAMRSHLSMPDSLWRRMLKDLDQAQALFLAYEPPVSGDGPGSYRAYLELMPPPDELRRLSVMPLGCGYKWDPETGREIAVSVYRMRYLPDLQAFQAHLAPRIERLAHRGIRSMAQALIDDACAAGDPARFMFLEVDDEDAARNSITVTFRGTDIPVRKYLPDMLGLAAQLALRESDVLSVFVPDEPRSIYSLAAGMGRDGHEFLTLYYD